MPKEALFWEALEDGRVRCNLCPHRCVLSPGAKGICRIRENIDGKLYSTGYGRTTSLAMDPIEKKPLFHYKPGSYILSVAPNGCNLRCRWCQNWEISQAEVPTRFIPPKELVEIAEREGSAGISFTYTEPLVWYEYIVDVAQEAKPRGLGIVLVTNGYINEEPLLELLPYVDAMNIDLKAMDDEVYRRYIGGRLKPVLRTIELSAERTLIEVTNLIIPTVNDSERSIHAVVDFIAGVDPKIPLHFSRYFPSYRFSAPPTPPEVLLKAYNLAREKLPYVYIGNLLVPGTENTYCPNCGNLLVERRGFWATVVGIKGGRCDKCNAKADFVL